MCTQTTPTKRHPCTKPSSAHCPSKIQRQRSEQAAYGRQDMNQKRKHIVHMEVKRETKLDQHGPFPKNNFRTPCKEANASDPLICIGGSLQKGCISTVPAPKCRTLTRSNLGRRKMNVRLALCGEPFQKTNMAFPTVCGLLSSVRYPSQASKKQSPPRPERPRGDGANSRSKDQSHEPRSTYLVVVFPPPPVKDIVEIKPSHCWG